MNNKIIGFTISPYEIIHTDVDIFEVGLTFQHFKHQDLNIYFWGIGDLSKCFLRKKQFSLSFPLTSSLEDRNILVSLGRTITIENDWLGSIPVFYNEKSHVISTLMNKVLPESSIELHSEGFLNYLEFGYSILEQTPINNVKFLRYYSAIEITRSAIHIKHKKDIFLNNLENSDSEPKRTIQALIREVRKKEKLVNGKIIIPSSGGYDSRFLNSAVKDKSRVLDFTYGVSDDQSKSYEVVKAKEVAKRLNIEWKQISLGDFNKYAENWLALFGCSTHLHGMYHMEFYQKIKKGLGVKEASLLSGIIGDAWSGKVDSPQIESIEDLTNLSYSHGVSLDPKHSPIKALYDIRRKFVKKYKPYLNNEKTRIIFTMRFKFILLNYLMAVPDYLGYPSWTPFLESKVAIEILNLPKRQKENRLWQEEYFKKNGIFVEDDQLVFDNSNTLDLVALVRQPVREIDRQYFLGLINEKKLNQLSSAYRKLSNYRKPLINKLLAKRKLGPVLYQIGFREKNDYLRPFSEMMILKSLEHTFKRQEE